jgi:hypothetical protein
MEFTVVFPCPIVVSSTRDETNALFSCPSGVTTWGLSEDLLLAVVGTTSVGLGAIFVKQLGMVMNQKTK